jgi:hypothetical protein
VNYNEKSRKNLTKAAYPNLGSTELTRVPTKVRGHILSILREFDRLHSICGEDKTERIIVTLIDRLSEIDS